MSGFCCFSMTNPNPTEASQSECPYFDKTGFRDLFVSADARTWCALHAPKEIVASPNGTDVPQPIDLLHRLVQFIKRHGNSNLDLRRTNWRSALNFGDFAKTIGQAKFSVLDFSEATFEGALTWDSHYPADRVIFDRANLCGDSTFKSIPIPISCRETKFLGAHTNTEATQESNYSKSIIHGDFLYVTGRGSTSVDFSDAHFHGKAKFSIAAHIPQKVNLTRVLCNDSLMLQSSNQAVSDLDLSFSRVVNDLTVRGVFANFGLENVTCGSLSFLGDVQKTLGVRDLKCQGNSIFSGVFANLVDFSDAVIEGQADFSSATFNAGAVFRNVAFKQQANFSNTLFSNAVDFSLSVFSSEAIFATNKTDRSFKAVTLDSVSFKSRASFTNRKFEAPLSCRNTIFSHAPDFHGCVFHQDTSFKGAKFLDARRDEAAAAYRTLKLAMEGLRAKDEEALFYALEQRSWRKNANGVPFTRIVSLLYDFGSDYGRSIGKPLGLFGASLLIFSSLYFLNYESFNSCLPATADVWVQVENAVRYQFTQLVRPFDAVTIRSSDSPATARCTVPFWLAGVSALQTLLQLSLIALLFLAIRRRFKME